jgi:hypothetical protein
MAVPTHALYDAILADDVRTKNAFLRCGSGSPNVVLLFLTLFLTGCGEVESRDFEVTELSMVYQPAGEELSNQVAFFTRNDLDREWEMNLTGELPSPIVTFALFLGFDDDAIVRSGGNEFFPGPSRSYGGLHGRELACGAGLATARVVPPSPDEFESVDIRYEDECLSVNVSFRAD